MYIHMPLLKMPSCANVGVRGAIVYEYVSSHYVSLCFKMSAATSHMKTKQNKDIDRRRETREREIALTWPCEAAT